MSTDAFVKTPKGIAEMEKRSEGLSPRERRVLILIDGSRDADALAGMFPNEDMPAILAKLSGEGFIAGRGAVSPKPAVAPPADDAGRFDMAQNFMVNTTNHFLGPMGSSLVARLRGCGGFPELRALYDAWREGIGATGEGRKQLPDLEGRLAALLS